MKLHVSLSVILGMVLAFSACQSTQVRMLVDSSSIPDRTYNVTEYRGPTARSYAVLFDIPDDTTPFNERTKLDMPQGYIERFQERVRGHRTVRISDPDGTIRGYLIVSNLLNDRVRSGKEQILVVIEDPYTDYLKSVR
jgi:type IV secretory pathway protease TraF